MMSSSVRYSMTVSQHDVLPVSWVLGASKVTSTWYWGEGGGAQQHKGILKQKLERKQSLGKQLGCR